MKNKTISKRDIYNDTCYLPNIIAEHVAFEEIDKYLPKEQQSDSMTNDELRGFMHSEQGFKMQQYLFDMALKLEEKAVQCYANSAHFRKTIGKGSDKGRMKLFAFMAHWFEAFYQKQPLTLSCREYKVELNYQ